MITYKDGGPAFPIPIHSDSCPCPCGNTGMSFRDYFAGQAIIGILALPGTINGKADKSLIEMAALAYQQADAMLKEREKK